jgi:hypothetical protein
MDAIPVPLQAPVPQVPPARPPDNHRLVAGPPYPTYEDLAVDLKDWAEGVGFCFSQRRGRKYKDGKPTRIDLYCDRARFRPSRGTGLRNNTTHKTEECTWLATCAALAENKGLWTIQFKGEHTGHTASERLTEHVGHRALTDEQRAYIQELFDVPGLRNRAISDRLIVKWPGINFIQKDIENMRAAHNKQRLGGYTPTQALIKRFVDQGIDHVVRFDPRDGDRVLGLVWTYPWCKTTWKRFWWVLHLDNTYNTNRFKLAFFEAVVLTNIGTIAPVFFALVDNERQEGFDFLIGELDAMRVRCGIPAPVVVITDQEAALKKTLVETFPSAKQQLCIFHHNKNAILNIKRKWKKPPGVDDDAEDHLYQYDDAGNPISTQTAAAPDASLDAEDANALNEANGYARVRTGEWINIGQLPDRFEHSKAGIYLLWRYMIYASEVFDFERAWPG